MNPILLILRRELGAYLRTPMGWVIVSVLLCIDGLLFNAFAVGRGARLSAEVLHDFFYYTSGPTMIAALLLSMRLFAEERQMGTLVLLNTAPLREWEIVVGKFLSAFLFLAGMTAATIYMPLLILVHGKIALGQVAVGYAGLLLIGAASTAIGVFASALARTQIVAGVIGAAVMVPLLILWMLANVAEPPLREVLAALALHARHFAPFMDGVLHTRDIFYYAAMTYFFLLLSTRVLEARRWR